MTPLRALLLASFLAAWLTGTAEDAHARKRGFFLITSGEVVRKVEDVPKGLGKGGLADIRDSLESKGIRDPELVFALMDEGAAIGHKYDQFGLFWLEIWTWGSEPGIVFVEENAYQPVDAKDLEKLLGHEPGVSWRYRYPPGLLVVVGLVGLMILGAAFGKSDEQGAKEKFEELMQDERYRTALDIIEREGQGAAADPGASDIHSDDAGDAADGDSSVLPGGSSLVMAATAAEAAIDHNVEPPADDGGYSKAVDHLVEQGIGRKQAEENLSFLIHVLVAASEVHDGGDE